MESNYTEDIKSSLLNDNIANITENGNTGLEYSENGEYDTLNESICTSIKREFIRIWNKLQFAVIPRFSSTKQQNLRQWDLWGPLFFTILLS